MEKLAIVLKKKNHLIKMVEIENEKNQRAKNKKIALHKGLIDLKKRRDELFKNLKKKNETCVNFEGKMRHLEMVKLNYKRRLANVCIDDDDMKLV